jgi:hypothetical protein
MAYLSPAYEHDVFVSYSHGDPEGRGNSPLKAWSNALVDTLAADIKALSGDFRDLAVWYDRDLDPTLNLTAELRRQVEASAILMILMSPYYLKSAWCGDERAWFEAQVAARAGETGRVFVVRAVPTDTADWPDFLRDERGYTVLGFRFHPPPQRPGDMVEPYGWRGRIEGNEPFLRELATLRTALTRRLSELKVRAAASEAPAVLPATVAAEGARPSRLYLHVRPEHAAMRGAIDEALAGGCTIVAPPPPPTVSGDAAWLDESRARIAAARHCDALALLRPSADEAFLGDLLDVGVDERERVRAARGTPLPCAVLDGSGAPLEIDAARFGIERFNLADPEWPAAFLAWLGRTRMTASGLAQ